MIRVAKDSEEISREGGMVTVTDIYGFSMNVTKDEAMYFPFAASYRRWRLIDGYWLDPVEVTKAFNEKPLALVK